MKVKIELDKGETQEQAEEQLLKALRGKKKAEEQLKERYADPVLNEFHDKILKDHLDLMDDIKTIIEKEVRSLVSSR